MAYTAVNKVAKAISAGIPSHYHVNLENQLALAWGVQKRLPRQSTRRPRAENISATRDNYARWVYMQIQEHNVHLFLPFILAKSPRSCQGLKIKEILELDWSHVQTDNSAETKRLIEGIALRQSCSQNTSYIRFMMLMFPLGSLISLFLFWIRLN
jgi:hypothetical protein